MSRFVIRGNYADEEKNNMVIAPAGLVACQCSFLGKNNVLKISPNAKLKNLFIEFLGDDGYCEIDNSPRLSGSIRIGYASSVTIEKNVSATNRIYLTCAEGTKVFIGEDCMFATNNQIRTDDAHGIYDVHTGKRVNLAKDIYIGKHVWVGFNAVILGGIYRRWFGGWHECFGKKTLSEQLHHRRQSSQAHQKRRILGKTLFAQCQTDCGIFARAISTKKSLQTNTRRG